MSRTTSWPRHPVSVIGLFAIVLVWTSPVARASGLCQTTYEGNAVSPRTMSTMMAVAASADLETYSNWDTWGTPGFCWYNNDVEDGVSEEGVDCTGLVAKVWYLNRLSGYSTNGSYYYWSPTFYSRTIYISSTTFASGASNAS